MDLKKTLREYRPNVKDITINNYSKYLNKLATLITDKKFVTIKPFLKPKVLISKIQDRPLSTQKAYIASVLVLLNNNDKYEKELTEYRKYLEAINSKYEAERMEKKKTETEDKNWATMKQINEVREKLKKKVELQKLFSKSTLTAGQFNLLRSYIIASLYTLLPPRRNIYNSVKLISKKAYNKLRDAELKKNYLVYNGRQMFLHLGEQKSKNFNEQTLQVPKKLKTILKKYLDHKAISNNDLDLLLTTAKGKKLTTQNMTNILNKVFNIEGKKISSTMLRKIYVSEVIAPHIEKVQEAAEAMGHSTTIQNKNYNKK